MESKRYRGSEIKQVADALAQLRITVFKDFPYLYDGDETYEKEYLKTYIDSPDSFVFIVFDGNKMAGATTCIPLKDETEEVKAPFLRYDYDISQIIYFGESILLNSYRGQGWGNTFFDERERYARSLGSYTSACFCAVQRPASHPLAPDNYKPLDDFWIRRGYRKTESLKTEFSWRDTGEMKETAKPMQFWMKRL